MVYNVVSPLELFSALQRNGGIENSVSKLYDMDNDFIGEIMTKYKRSFEYFSKIKRCNEIIFKGNILLLCYYSNITQLSVNCSDITNPVGDITENDKSVTDNDEDSVTDILVDKLGEEYIKKGGGQY